MRSDAGVVSVAEAAKRLGVSKGRVSQLLNELCTFVDPPIFELLSPQGHPVGTTRVIDRTVSLASVDAYAQRHPKSAAGKRRTRHASVGAAQPTPQSRNETRSRTPPDVRSSSTQTLRLELEHQLDLNRALRKKLGDQHREAIERDRALKHRIVDLEAELELSTTAATNRTEDLAGLRSAFDTYGDVLTQDIGPQDPADI